MFILRFALLPVVVFCLTIVAATFDAHFENANQKATWLPIKATVTDSQDIGAMAAEFSGRPNDFPDPYGAVRYSVGGKSYAWQGRGRDIGVTALPVGEEIDLFYDPADPSKINTLVLLGRSTGRIIFGAAVAFLIFYVWFFWLRGRGGGGRFLPPASVGEPDPPPDFVDRTIAPPSNPFHSAEPIPQRASIAARQVSKAAARRAFGRR